MNVTTNVYAERAEIYLLVTFSVTRSQNMPPTKTAKMGGVRYDVIACI